MSDKPDARPEIRRAQRVLRMVHELHKQGYQRLRIVPGMSASGCYWRCSITPITDILVSHGALPRYYGAGIEYSSGMENKYFDWKDAKHDTARQLAAKFIERFPEVVRAGAGSDWNYAGWYVEMLGFAERGNLPVAYADWYGGAPDYLAKDDDRNELPFPPPGEAKSRDAPLTDSDGKIIQQVIQR